MDFHRTVLLAHGDNAYLEQLVMELSAQGVQVVGSARTADSALALAETRPAAVAVVGRELAGAHSGETLAKLLEARWGVQTHLIDREKPEVLIETLSL